MLLCRTISVFPYLRQNKFLKFVKNINRKPIILAICFQKLHKIENKLDWEWVACVPSHGSYLNWYMDQGARKFTDSIEL